MGVRLERSFFSKIPLIFSEQSGETNERSERNCERRSHAWKAGGRSKAKAGGAMPRTSGASGRRREATEGRRPSQGRASQGRASIYRPSEAASNSAVEKCSLFVVSSPLLGGSMHPIGEDTEKRRNGTEAA